MDEAVPLAAALVGHLCETHGIRHLIIKGDSAVAAGLRPARPSADTDLLLHPEDETLFHRALTERGWKVRPFEDDMGLPKHSSTYYHPQWPCDIDAHFRFPGLEAEPAQTFEALAAPGTFTSLAGHHLPTLDVYGHIIIQATHALRDQHRDHAIASAAPDYEFLCHQIWAGACDVDWPKLASLIEATDSWAALRPFLEHVFPDETRTIPFPAPSDDWTRRTLGARASSYKTQHLLAAPLPEKLTILRRAFFPTREDLAVSDLSVLDASPLRLANLRLRRLLRFAGRLPVTVRDVIKMCRRRH